MGDDLKCADSECLGPCDGGDSAYSEMLTCKTCKGPSALEVDCQCVTGSGKFGGEDEGKGG